MKSSFVLLVLLILSACNHSGKTSGKEQVLYQMATEAMLKGESSKAIDMFRRFIKTNRNDLYVGDARYHIGRLMYKKEQFTLAKIEFLKAIATARREQTQALAKFYLAKTYMADSKKDSLSKRTNLALDLYEDLEDNASHLLPHDELYFLLGKCYLYLSHKSSARKVFSTLLKKYPRSKYAVAVNKRGLHNFKSYSLQLAAYKSYEGCKEAMAVFKAKGVNVILVTSNKYYYIRIGPFKTFDLAQKQATILKSKDMHAILKP